MDPDAEKTVDQAWQVLPLAHRGLLVEIRADKRAIHCGPLGSYANTLLTSAGCPPLTRADEQSRNEALGLWLPDLRLILINVCHGSLVGLDAASREAALAHVAWHEWGHALGFTQAGHKDVAEGPRFLELLPPEMAEYIRAAGYGRREYTHEVVADLYAVLMMRRKREMTQMPNWLNPELPGYLLPANKSMADVLRLNEELLASESQGQGQSGQRAVEATAGGLQKSVSRSAEPGGGAICQAFMTSLGGTPRSGHGSVQAPVTAAQRAEHFQATERPIDSRKIHRQSRGRIARGVADGTLAWDRRWIPRAPSAAVGGLLHQALFLS